MLFWNSWKHIELGHRFVVNCERFLVRRQSTSGNVFEVTSSSFEQSVLKSAVPVVLDCYAPWCQPCKQLTPLLSEAVASTKGRVVLALLDTDREAALTDSLQIKSLPTVFGVVGGRVADHFVGGQTKEFVAQFVARLAKASKASELDAPADASSAKRIMAKANQLLKSGDHKGANALIQAEYERLESEATSTKRRGLSKLFDEKQPEANEAAWLLEVKGRCALAAEDVDAAKAILITLRDSKRSAILDRDLDLKSAVANLDLAIQELTTKAQDENSDFEQELSNLRTLFATNDSLDKSAAIDEAADLLVQVSDHPERKEQARTLILAFIDAIQATDPADATAARKRLANILFGNKSK